MLYLKSKCSLLLSVMFLMCSFFSAVFQNPHLLLFFCGLTIFFAIAHVRYDFAYIDYDQNNTKDSE